MNQTPKQTQKLAEWIKARDSNIHCLEVHFRSNNTNRLKVKRWKKIIHVKSNQRRTQVPVLVPDKVDFKLKGHKRQRRTILIKCSIQKEDILRHLVKTIKNMK